MMSPLVLVTDTNIWIDLDNGGILDDVFRLPYRTRRKAPAFRPNGYPYLIEEVG